MSQQIQNLTLIISILFLAAILYYADWALISEKSHLISPGPILLAALVFMIFQVAKAVQFTVFIPKHAKPRFSSLYYVMSKHAYYLSVLPVRLGDIYYSTFLKKHTSIPHRLGNLSLIMARVYDVLILSVFTMVGLSYVSQSLPTSINIIILSLSAISILIIFNLSRCMNISRSMINRISGQDKHSLLNRISDHIAAINEEIQMQNKTRLHFFLLITTALNWSGTIIMFWIVLNMFQLKIDLVTAMFLVGMVNLTSVIPIQSIGGFGLRETGLLTALVLTGMDYQESIAYAIIARFILYMIQLITSVIIMLFFSIFLKSRIEVIQ